MTSVSASAARSFAKREPVIILGQSLATIIYIRNIMLIVKHRARGSKVEET